MPEPPFFPCPSSCFPLALGFPVLFSSSAPPRPLPPVSPLPRDPPFVSGAVPFSAGPSSSSPAPPSAACLLAAPLLRAHTRSTTHTTPVYPRHARVAVVSPDLRRASARGACGQRCVDSKNSQTTPATTSTSSIRQLLGAADTQTAHHATFSAAPTHQLLGSANAETTPARAPAAAADRK